MIFAAAGINQTINFQGKVTNIDGTNVADGSYDFVFKLYNVSSGGTAQWTETWNSGTAQVTVTDGVFRVALGTYQSLSSLDFNNDTWYLGIDFNGDGEMTPRVQLTAVPYAFNAKQVNGLTVTNDSGNPFSSLTTLKIGDGKTVDIQNGLTFSGTDGKAFVFPNISGSSDNVVTEAFTQTLTNKTIGSTGLTFSGATTDITTGTNEDFVLNPNGSGKIGFGITNPVGWFDVKGSGAGNALAIFNQLDSVSQADILTASSAGTTKFRIDYNGNVGVGSSMTDTLSSWLSLAAATTGKSSLNIAAGTAPTTPNDGDIWYTGSGGSLFFRKGTTTKDLLAAASGSTAWDSLTAPITQNLSLSMSTFTTAFSWATGTSTNNLFSLATASNSNGTGALLRLDTPGTSNTIMPLRITANGKEALMVDAGGNVGIGTTAPTAQFQIGASSKNLQLFTTGIYIDLGATGSPLAINWNGQETYINPNAGNVGIGTTSPLAKFDVNGSASISGNLSFSGARTIASNAMNNLTLGDGNTGSIILNPSGNVGIGTTNPGYTLDMAGNTTSSIGLHISNTNSSGTLGIMLGNDTSATQSQIFLNTSTNNLYGGPNSLNFYNTNSNPIVFQTNNNTRLFISGSGNVGVGSNMSPLAKLDVGGNASISGNLTFSGARTIASTALANLTIGDGNTGNIILNPSGNVGIGVSNTGAARLKIGDASTSLSQLNFGNGVTGPSSPAKGDMWWDGTHLYFTTDGSGTKKDLLAGGGGAFTSSGGLTYQNTATDDVLFGGSTVPTAASSTTTFMMDVSTGMLYLGNPVVSADSGINGGLTFYNSGGNTAASITTDSSGNLILSAPAGSVQMGSGTGDITISFVNGSDQFIASRVYSGSTPTEANGADFEYKRTITGGTNALSGVVFEVDDTSSSSNTINPTLIKANAAPTSGTYTGNLADLQVGGTSKVTIDYTGGLTISRSATTTKAINLSQDSTVVNGGIAFGTTTPVYVYRSAAGELTIGDGTNGLVLSASTGPAYQGTMRPSKVITLSPEYAGAVLTAFYGAGTDSSNITGSMTSDAETSSASSANLRTYYQWTSSTVSPLQFYTVAVRVTLPQDFAGWDTSQTNPLTIDYVTSNATNTNNYVNAYIYLQSNSTTAVTSNTSNNASTTWTSIGFTNTNLTGGSVAWNTAGQSAVIYLHLAAMNSNTVRIGDIKLYYKAKF